MRTVILVLFWFEVINLCCRLVLLSTADYPRINMWSRGEDALVAFIAVLVGGCLGYLLWAAP